MSQNQKTVLLILGGIALLELGLTTRFTTLWKLAFGPNAKSGPPGSDTWGKQNPAPTYPPHAPAPQATTGQQNNQLLSWTGF